MSYTQVSTHNDVRAIMNGQQGIQGYLTVRSQPGKKKERRKAKKKVAVASMQPSALKTCNGQWWLYNDIGTIRLGDSSASLNNNNYVRTLRTNKKEKRKKRRLLELEDKGRSISLKRMLSCLKRLACFHNITSMPRVLCTIVCMYS